MLKKQIFGLDISDHSIEALILKKPNFGPPKVAAYARTLLKGEVVKNGIIKNPKKLGENITKLLASAQPVPIKTPYCILSLPESQVFTTIFKLPAGLKNKEIKNTIPYKAEEVIPFKSSEIYFDFKTIAVQGTTQEIFYVAVPTNIIDSYVDILESIGLKPVAFDLESISLSRSLIISPKKNEAKLLMDIGARTTNLNIFDRNGIRQNLAIKIAGDHFTRLVAKKLNLAPKQAEELKMKSGFDPKKGEGKVLLILQDEFKRVMAETKKFIDYYQTENQRPVSGIVLTGGSSLLPKIDQYLADNLGIEVNLGKPLSKVVDPKDLVKFQTKAILFSNVIGLALRGVAKDPVGCNVNLLPIKKRKFTLVPDKKEKKKWLIIYIELAIAVVLFLILISLFFWQKNNQDLYRRFFPALKYSQTIINPKVDLNTLDQIRKAGLKPPIVSTSTPTTTPGLIESEKIIRIKKTTTGFLIVRNGPSANNSKIGEAKSGSEFKLLKEENGWYQIEFEKGKFGWVLANFVDLIETKNENNQQVLGAAVELTTKIKIKPTSTGYLNVRSGPGTSYDQIGQVLPGQEFFTISEKNNWYEIRLNNQKTGWVSSIYVEKVE